MMSKPESPSLSLRSLALIMETPCKDCDDREVGCHGKCAKYNEHRERCAEDRKKRFDSYAPEHQVENYYIDGCYRRKMRRR